MGWTTVRSVLLASYFLAGVGGLLPAASEENWSTIREPDFGFAYSYPKTLFYEVEGDGRPSFNYFESSRSEAKFLVGAWDNQEGDTPESFKQWLTDNADGYRELTYQPRGRSWFVLSGFRDDQIFYEKVMFSCGGRVVNVLAIAYPERLRGTFDPIVERMEDRFRPGRRCF